MLLLSQQCFNDALDAASTKEGEKWMHYYMLGKASENLKKPVDTYLTYYQQVCILFILIVYSYCHYVPRVVHPSLILESYIKHWPVL